MGRKLRATVHLTDPTTGRTEAFPAGTEEKDLPSSARAQIGDHAYTDEQAEQARVESGLAGPPGPVEPIPASSSAETLAEHKAEQKQAEQEPRKGRRQA